MSKVKKTEETPAWHTQLTPGECYIVTDVTSMVYVGRLVLQDGPRAVLQDAAWVSDTGARLGQFMRDGRDEGMEVEYVGFRTVYWAGWSPWPHEPFKRSYP